jgi:hypothetical protein
MKALKLMGLGWSNGFRRVRSVSIGAVGLFMTALKLMGLDLLVMDLSATEQ